MTDMNIGDQVTIPVTGKSRIAGLLRSIDGDTVNVATRFGMVNRPMAGMRPIDDGFTLNADAIAAINNKNA